MCYYYTLTFFFHLLLLGNTAVRRIRPSKAKKNTTTTKASTHSIPSLLATGSPNENIQAHVDKEKKIANQVNSATKVGCPASKFSHLKGKKAEDIKRRLLELLFKLQRSTKC